MLSAALFNFEKKKEIIDFEQKMISTLAKVNLGHHNNMALKNLYVFTILPSYFSSWETWKR